MDTPTEPTANDAGEQSVSDDRHLAQRRVLFLNTLKAASYIAPATLALISMEARAGS